MKESGSGGIGSGWISGSGSRIGHEDDLPDFPLLDGLTLPLDVASAAAGSPDLMALLAGQAVGLNRETTAAALVERLVEETRAAMARLAG